MRAVLLGTSNALATAQSDNTSLVLDLPSGPLLIDCAGAPAHRLLQLGLDPLRLQAVFLTHAHPDHLYGWPALLQHLWLAQPEKEVTVIGLEETLRVARLLSHEAFELHQARVRWVGIPPEPGYSAWQGDGLELHAYPVAHYRPCIGLRIGDLAYSGDTAPYPGVIEAARGARVLLHEATVLESSDGHSTLEEAARAAAEAGVEELVAVHLHPRWQEDPQDAAEVVSRHFGGRFRVAIPGMEIAVEA